MRLLLDTCLSPRTRDELRMAGHDVVWSGDWEADPGDEILLSAALREGRITVTLDRDFGELAIVHHRPHAGILRLVGFASRAQALSIQSALERYGHELTTGAIVTVEPGRVRVRPRDPEAS